MARRSFGNTWWGEAWLDALTARAVHEPNRLPRGRAYARQSRASDLEFEPGLVRAPVRGTRPQPYDVLLSVREFRADEWECVFDAIMQRAGYAAALLDGELDPGIVDQLDTDEVYLLPQSGELRTSCNCPDDAEPCKHAAAVCYLVADALDWDPFVVLLLRGKTREEVLDEIRARRSALADEAASVPAVEVGMPASDAWSRHLGPLPLVPPPPGDGAGRVAPWPSDPPGDAPFDAEGLRLLVADASRRAWRLRVGTGTSGLELSSPHDLARRAEFAPESERREIAFRAGIARSTMWALADAWMWAGADGLRELEEPPWPAPVVEMVSAKGILEDWGVPEREIVVKGNRVTVSGEVQYRRGRDSRWYRFVKRSNKWALDAPAADEFDDLLD